MATTSRGWIPVATGIATTALAVWVAVAAVAPTDPPAAPTAGTPTTTERAAGATPPEAPDPVVINMPPPEIDGLTESITRVLASEGFASSLTADDAAAQLPASVYRTLVANGVVLSIAEESRP